MVSRLPLTKLKAFLIIDLIVFGAFAGTYLYLQSQGLVTTGVKPAEFVLSNLTFDPIQAFPGDTIQISVNVTNVGGVEGNRTLGLEINNATKDSTNITLGGGESSIVGFTDLEVVEGNYSVKVGDLVGSFTILPAPPETSKIILSNLKVDPFEVWTGDPITLTADADNPSPDADKLTIKVKIDDTVVESKLIEMEAKASQKIEFTINATAIEGRHTIKMNTLSGSFTIVKTGYHTLTIARSGGGSKSLPFTLNGVGGYGTPYTALLPVGEYSISMPDPFNVGTGVLAFGTWSDGGKTPSRTFTLDKRLILVATYNLISGYASCPSLLTWNGTGYSFSAYVSNTGWLGYIDYINANGKVVFGGGNPWDYVKLDKNQLTIKDGYYDMALFQQWDEFFYIDSVYMMTVDHPIGSDVYTSMSNYVNQAFNGQIYTINQTSIKTPVSAINEKGANVLPQISKMDGVFTPGSSGFLSPAWNNLTFNQLTLDLGNLSSANQIKLLIKGMIDWGEVPPYYNWIDQFKTAAAQGLVHDGTEIMPPPYLEIKDANGKWTSVSQDKQIPIPSDYNARTFVVDLTGLFPKGISDYQIRMTNFNNVTFDYIGIDLTTQQNITIQKIIPTATLSQVWETQSIASGAFTRYGDVTPLIQNADDMYIIGRQGDQVNLKFSTANLKAPAKGMERDYFVFVACWFKDPPDGFGYGFPYTVNPLPFISMSGFPYPNTESYPYDAEHTAYLNQYNTRIITTP